MAMAGFMGNTPTNYNKPQESRYQPNPSIRISFKTILKELKKINNTSSKPILLHSKLLKLRTDFKKLKTLSINKEEYFKLESKALDHNENEALRNIKNLINETDIALAIFPKEKKDPAQKTIPNLKKGPAFPLFNDQDDEHITPCSDALILTLSFLYSNERLNARINHYTKNAADSLPLEINSVLLGKYIVFLFKMNLQNTLSYSQLKTAYIGYEKASKDASPKLTTIIKKIGLLNEKNKEEKELSIAPNSWWRKFIC